MARFWRDCEYRDNVVLAGLRVVEYYLLLVGDIFQLGRRAYTLDCIKKLLFYLKKYISFMSCYNRHVMPDIVLIAHNIRSTHNIGAIFRTCEGLGISRIILSGYTPYPAIPHDTRLPHIVTKLTTQIQKTALGAEILVPYEHQPAPEIQALKDEGYTVIGLEQDDRSIMINDYKPPDKIALLLGEEVSGIDDVLRTECDVLLEIPMRGKKESFNVSVAAGMALYALTVAS